MALSSSLCFSRSSHMKTCPAENEKPGLESTSPRVMLISARHISTEHILCVGCCSGVWGYTDFILRQISFGFWLCHLPAMWSWATDRPLWASGSPWVKQQWGFHEIRHLVFSLAEYQCFINGAVMMLVTHPQRAQSLAHRDFSVCSLNFFYF